MARLGIVTVSYNVRELLRQCLASVRESLARSPLDAEVVVVDNASADGSAEMVRAEFPWARLLVNERNTGFAAANNLGLRALGFPDGERSPAYAMLLNPDTIVRGAALAELVAFMERTPRAGVAGARLVYGDGSFQHSAFRFPTLAMAFLDFFPHRRLLDSRLNGRYPRRLYEQGEPFAIDHPLGATLLVRREAAAQAGLLDERYFMYCEEIDWCRRIKGGGWGVYCVPRAEVVHLAGQSTQQFREEMFVALWRSRYQLFARHNSALYRWAVRLIVAAGLARQAAQVRRLVRSGALEASAGERRLRAYAQVRALGSGGA